MKAFDLSGRHALVTGSTRGIGAGIATQLEACGASVLRHGIGTDPAPNTIIADLCTENGVDQLLTEAFEKSPDLSILVCNVGSFFDTDFLQMTRERYAKTMAVNVEQAFFAIQGFSQRLISQGREGVIVLVSSTNGFQSEEDSVAYDTSKGAVVMLTRSTALNLAAKGIRVNGLAPGLIRTPLTSGWMDEQPEKVAHYNKKILAQRIGSIEECGDATAFLCSDASRYIYGQVLVVDGGLTVGQIGQYP